MSTIKLTLDEFELVIANMEDTSLFSDVNVLKKVKYDLESQIGLLKKELSLHESIKEHNEQKDVGGLEGGYKIYINEIEFSGEHLHEFTHPALEELNTWNKGDEIAIHCEYGDKFEYGCDTPHYRIKRIYDSSRVTDAFFQPTIILTSLLDDKDYEYTVSHHGGSISVLLKHMYLTFLENDYFGQPDLSLITEVKLGNITKLKNLCNV